MIQWLIKFYSKVVRTSSTIVFTILILFLYNNININAQFVQQGPKLVGTGAVGNAEQDSSSLIQSTENVYHRTTTAWVFKLIIGIKDNTVQYYGGMDSIKSKLLVQIQKVNNNFNTGVPFANSFNFIVDSIYQFTGSVYDQIFSPHPNQAYRIIYDGFPANGGGWYGSLYNSIYHSWSVNDFGGIFGGYATDGLTHEFGHSRGAIDLYAIAVDSNKNLINSKAYVPPNSIMNYPYGNIVWDVHSKNIINRNTDIVFSDDYYITHAFPPSFKIIIKDRSGMPIQDAMIKVYPVIWYKDSISNPPIYTQTSNSQGEFIFPTNPFGPNTTGYPWSIRYPNFLITVQKNQSTGFSWLPLTDVQNFYYENGTQQFVTTITIDNTDLIQEKLNINKLYALDQNYPNPFNPSTTINYSLSKEGNVKLTIFNALGSKVATIVDGYKHAGNYSAQFNGSNLASGIYLYRLESGNYSAVKKFILMK